MRETTLTIMGFPVIFRYTVYEGGYIEWHLKAILASVEFTELLLRVHYAAFIDTELRKVWFEEEYMENQINSSQLSLGIGDDDTVF
jgi:hypothetical protein